MAETKSYLATVKEELTQLFHKAYAECAEAFDALEPQRLPGILKKLQSDTWTVTEKHLKTSFMNGKKSATGMPGRNDPKSEDSKSAVPPNPFA